MYFTLQPRWQHDNGLPGCNGPGSIRVRVKRRGSTLAYHAAENQGARCSDAFSCQQPSQKVCMKKNRGGQRAETESLHKKMVIVYLVKYLMKF